MKLGQQKYSLFSASHLQITWDQLPQAPTTRMSLQGWTVPLNCHQNKFFLLEAAFSTAAGKVSFTLSCPGMHTLILGIYEHAVSHDQEHCRHRKDYRPHSIESNLDCLPEHPLSHSHLWKQKTFPSKSQGNVAECKMVSMRILPHGYPTGRNCSMKHMKR